jgi:putative membrane-bound dehydrogenase-like protein
MEVFSKSQCGSQPRASVLECARFAPLSLAKAAIYTVLAIAATNPAISNSAESQSTQPDQFPTEAELLKDVKVPAGFEAAIFAKPPMANYPVFIAAAPDGTLYVSSDGNGSLGRDPHRGRVLRLRDLDNDGRADEVKEFVKDVDSPRGLVWDHDRLYLLHPPHISEYIDKDGDGIAEDSRILVKNIAFTFKDRPADHSSNGMELGIDGWLYCAIGDFGFMEAEGTDGRKIQLRGGGAVRVRPDGSGLHIYAHGARNILEVAVSPTLDLISRDNTNDGGGWDVRLHHHTGLANHGYPSLFKNFSDEIIQPLADYGGGSGCGAAWIDEPGIPAEWNNAPFTCDWGRNWVYMHRLTPKGASFETNAPQKQFVGVTRPTDIDVDANSRIYVASWKGATFNWAGPNAGYIVQLRPKQYSAPSLPEFSQLSPVQLSILLEDPSHRRRLEAQRTILRKNLTRSVENQLVEKLDRNRNQAKPTTASAADVARVFSLALGKSQYLVGASSIEHLAEYGIRAIGEPDRVPPSVSEQAETEAMSFVLEHPNPRVRLQAAIAVAFRNNTNAAAALAQHVADDDRVVAQTVAEILKNLKEPNVCWPLVDSSAKTRREAALRILQGMHQRDVVDGLTIRLERERESLARRIGLFIALCRLYHTDAKWKGDSWGTRPDTSGPYYDATTWEESPRILRALNNAIEKATGEELAAFAVELNRHKVQSDTALTKILSAANTDEKLLPAAVGQLVRTDRIPPTAEALLVKTATAENLDDTPRAQAILALAKVKSDDAARAGFEGLAKLQQSKNSETEGLRKQARSQFIRSSLKPELLEQLSARGGDIGILADAALLNSREAFAKAWAQPNRKIQLLKAMTLIERSPYRDEVLAATEDADPEISKAAKETARVLRLDRPRGNTAKIESMSVPDAIAAVAKTKGDVELGKKLFTQQTCVNCHTISEKEPQRGPYLGNIAATYKRPELAEAILVPNKTLAQGFVANHFVLKDGDELDGFVTLEAADRVTIRDVTSQEHTIPTKNIAKRDKLEKSLMPEGLAAPLTLHEFASLLDYLENLNTK